MALSLNTAQPSDKFKAKNNQISLKNMLNPSSLITPINTFIWMAIARTFLFQM